MLFLRYIRAVPPTDAQVCFPQIYALISDFFTIVCPPNGKLCTKLSTSYPHFPLVRFPPYLLSWLTARPVGDDLCCGTLCDGNDAASAAGAGFPRGAGQYLPVPRLTPAGVSRGTAPGAAPGLGKRDGISMSTREPGPSRMSAKHKLGRRPKMPETPTFGRHAEIPHGEMTPEQQAGYRSLLETRGPLGVMQL